MVPKKYKRIFFPLEDSLQREILLAYLSSAGFDYFEEIPGGLVLYVPEDEWDENHLNGVLSGLDFAGKREITEVEERNWNALWESQIEPLTIKDKVYIRTSFHDPAPQGMIELIIDPKMSFGTGHHPTTELMMEMMLEENIRGKTVIDMGTGTGVLSVLAEKTGASKIYAIDNDMWSYENVLENIEKNRCSKIEVFHGDASVLAKLPPADLFLANINRNIILNDLQDYAKHLKKNGVLLLSGFYEQDSDVIKAEAANYGLKFTARRSKASWLGMKFVK
jgi:ribosomal protein L11 methyltransferase